jgi:uracil phosphoribosyltransferase
MIFNLTSQNSILKNYMLEIRDVEQQNNKAFFRSRINKIGQILAYEISAHLDYSQDLVQTPLDKFSSDSLSSYPILITILRAGLPLQQGLADILEQSEQGFVATYREHDTNGGFEIKLGYITCPDIADKVVILSDPMIATGQSVVATIIELLKIGTPSKIIIAGVIAVREGIELISQQFPEVDIFVAAIDPMLTSKSYISPGLGDAGDLSFGNKIQQ